MTHLTNISEEAGLVLVSALITALEKERRADGQPSLVDVLKAAISRAWIDDPQHPPGLRIGMADAQLVLEWVEDRLQAEGRERDPHFGDLLAGLPAANGQGGPRSKS